MARIVTNYLELGGLAVAHGSVVRGTLRDGPDDIHVLDDEVPECDVLGPAEPAASAVWWNSSSLSSPGLDTACEFGVYTLDVLRSHVLDEVDLSWVLPDRSHAERDAIVEGTIGNVDVAGILLHGD